MSFEVGQRVETEKNGKGAVAFVGTTSFADGDWIGVILDEPKGKNNGSVQGVAYFSCTPNHGLFVRPTQLKVESARGLKPPSSALKAPTSSLRKDSAHGSASRLSPGSSPKMSPAVSKENLSRASARKPSTVAAPPEKRRVAPSQKGPAVPSPLSPPKKEPPTPKAEEPPVPVEEPTTSASVLSRVKKMEEDTPVSRAVPPLTRESTREGMDEGTELELLRVQVKDMEEKLETLRMKRKEDREKLIEYERMKVQLSALSEYKNKAQDAHSALLRELQEKKQEADALREWRDTKQEEVMGAAEQLEMATIDKEMAEEKAEMLKDQVEELQAKVEELEADLAILREEMESGGGGVPEGNTIQLKQALQQNERMREALIKLRDSNGNAIAEKQTAEKEVEKMRGETAELLRMGELWKKRAEEAEAAVVNLKEQIDAYMGSEDVILHLTNSNLDLEEKIKLLEMEKEDLESMRDMDEQIAEEQKEVEKVLRQEIQDFEVSINELLLRQRQDEAHAEQLSQTIIKFRKKTAELNGEIEDLKDQILHLERELSVDKEDEKERAGQASLAMISAARTFALNTEWRVRGAELQYADRHIKYLKAFLPDNFSKPGGDNDCVQVSIIVPRISEKAAIFASLLKEKFPCVPGGMRMEHVTKSHKGEQWAHVAKASHICAAIATVCGQIESALSSTTVDRLSSIGHLQADFAVQERHLDNYLDLLKNGRFDENSSLDQLESALRYLTKRVLEEQLGSRDAWDGLEWTAHSCDTVLAAIDWWKVNEQRIAFLITSEGSDVVEWAKSTGKQMEAVEQMMRRAKTRLPSSSSSTLQVSESFFDSFSRAVFLIDRLSSLLHDTCALAANQLSMLAGESSGLESGRVKEMLHSIVEKNYGKTTVDKVFQPIEKEVATLTSCATEIQKNVEDGLMEVPSRKDNKYPPLIERAHSRKQAAADAEGLKWQMEKKENEMMELKKALKARMDDISNYKLRLEMADARMEQFSKVDSEREKHLQERNEQLVNELKKNKINYEETLDALQRDLNQMEAENCELKERAKNMSKKALLQGLQNIESMDSRASPGRSSISSPTKNILGLGGGGGGGANMAEVAILESQLAETLEALRRTTLEMRRAQAASSTVPLLHLPSTVSGPYSLAVKQSTVDTEFDAIEKEAEHLGRDEARFAFFTPNPLKSWKENEAERQRWKEDRELFLFRVQSCRRRLQEYWSSRHPGQPVPKLLNIQPKQKIIPESELNVHSKTFKDICGKWGIAVA